MTYALQLPEGASEDEVQQAVIDVIDRLRAQCQADPECKATSVLVSRTEENGRTWIRGELAEGPPPGGDTT